ncbi:MAG TPA: ABC transporter ATP-binding protein [Gaiellaceae bacterium]|nr:ABC transporter ATP-binding protein [Gaiellaceae bacterium]
MDAAEIEFREATKRYPGRREAAVDRLSLRVAPGEVCVLVGPSGAGKTTALKLVNRLVELDDGDVLVGGHSVRQLDATALRRGIGYVIQQAGLFPHLTVASNVATVPKLLGWKRSRIDARVRELLELVGLDPLAYGPLYPSQLSGGQRQRVGLARALAADPGVLLMDEPFGALDPITRARLQEEFLALQREVRKTVVFVTHDVDEATTLADRVAVLREGGSLAQHAPPDELLAAPADEFVARFLGADRGLKRLALRRLGDVELEPAELVRPGDPELPAATSLRDAVSAMLAGGRARCAVADAGAVRGSLSLERVAALLGRNGSR